MFWYRKRPEAVPRWEITPVVGLSRAKRPEVNLKRDTQSLRKLLPPIFFPLKLQVKNEKFLKSLSINFLRLFLQLGKLLWFENIMSYCYFFLLEWSCIAFRLDVDREMTVKKRIKDEFSSFYYVLNHFCLVGRKSGDDQILSQETPSKNSSLESSSKKHSQKSSSKETSQETPSKKRKAEEQAE